MLKKINIYLTFEKQVIKMKSKYAVLEALFITILITTTALISAGVAYAWKYGKSYKVILTAKVKTKRTDKGDKVEWGAGVFDWNKDDGVEYVKEYYEFKILPVKNHWWINADQGWFPRSGYAYGSVHYDYKYYYDIGYLEKARTYMKGHTLAYGEEGKLTVTTTVP